jgi:hypothetical protein
VLARVNGQVRSIEDRSGTKNDRAWRMRTARILFADQDFAEVILSDAQTTVLVGDDVDWIVKIEARGGFLNCTFSADYPAPVYAAASL